MDDVDLALVIALDCSASISVESFGLMASGCAAGLRDESVIQGLTGGSLGGSLCTLMIWSSVGAYEVMVDWTRLGSPDEIAAFAEAVENVPRVIGAYGATAVGEALRACGRQLLAKPAAATRSVIDMVGNGKSNQGVKPAAVRDALVAAGVTINGLCVLHDEPDLLAHYEAEVIGGPGAFAMTCQDFSEFEEAMRQKLQREIIAARRSDLPA
jgi:Ca-activated chloride channel homolog